MAGHTLNTGTVANVIVGLVGIRIGTVDTMPATTDQVGYSEEGANLEYTPSVTNIMVAEESSPIKSTLDTEEVKVMLSMAEATLANMNIAFVGADNDIQSMVRIGSNDLKYHSLLLEGEAPGDNNGIRQVLCQKISSLGTVGHPYRKNQKQLLPLELTAFTPTAGRTVYIFDFWEKTVSSDSVAFETAKPSMRLNGEGDANDDLSTVTGGSTGDIMVIRAKPGIEIALQHSATPTTGQLSLAGATNLTLDDPRDWIEMSSDGTYWTETDKKADF